MQLGFSAGFAEIIGITEGNKLPIDFYKASDKTWIHKEFHSCEGDLILICNALADYADILMEYIKQEDMDGYSKAFFEIHAGRCRKIGSKFEAHIGYDRDAAIEKCKHQRNKKKEKDSDVGEDALVLAARKRREKTQEKEIIDDKQTRQGKEKRDMKGQLSLFGLN